MSKTVLIVDDDKQSGELIRSTLAQLGYEIRFVASGPVAIQYVRQYRPSLVILSVLLPQQEGLEVLKDVKREFPELYVITLGSRGNTKLAIQSVKSGAYDYLEKPFEREELEVKVKNVFEKMQLERKVSELQFALGEKYKLKSIIGQSSKMRRVYAKLEAASSSNVSVVIQGESGTGKELIARAIHYGGSVKDGPFVAVNCAAIPSALLESELFGFEKGAFTGAVSRKIGKFEQASGGTIFMDEIGDLPPLLQVKLLRALQERELEHLGGNRVIPINARFLFAANQALDDMVRCGRFREDLYFRINVLTIEVPPLRERREDIPELLNYFIHQSVRGQSDIKIDPEAMKKLMEYHWPGNIRELENFVERTLLLHHGRRIRAEDVDVADVTPTRMGSRPLQTLEDAECFMIQNALRKSDGNMTETSRLLHISRDTLYRKLKKYDLVSLHPSEYETSVLSRRRSYI